MSVTKEQIKDWEKKHQEVRRVELSPLVKDGKETLGKAVFYLKRPDRSVIKFAMSKQVSAEGSIDLHSPGEIVLKNCYLGGDDVQTDDRYFFRACREALTYMNQRLGF